MRISEISLSLIIIFSSSIFSMVKEQECESQVYISLFDLPTETLQQIFIVLECEDLFNLVKVEKKALSILINTSVRKNYRVGIPGFLKMMVTSSKVSELIDFLELREDLLHHKTREIIPIITKPLPVRLVVSISMFVDYYRFCNEDYAKLLEFIELGIFEHIKVKKITITGTHETLFPKVFQLLFDKNKLLLEHLEELIIERSLYQILQIHHMESLAKLVPYLPNLESLTINGINDEGALSIANELNVLPINCSLKITGFFYFQNQTGVIEEILRQFQKRKTE